MYHQDFPIRMGALMGPVINEVLPHFWFIVGPLDSEHTLWLFMQSPNRQSCLLAQAPKWILTL